MSENSNLNGSSEKVINTLITKLRYNLFKFPFNIYIYIYIYIHTLKYNIKKYLLEFDFIIFYSFTCITTHAQNSKLGSQYLMTRHSSATWSRYSSLILSSFIHLLV